MNACDYCDHVEMCSWRKDLNEQGCEFYADGNKWMPCDAYKRTMIKGYGKDVLVTDDGEIIHGTFADYEHGANASGYISHFATCPNANQHRKR